MWRKCFGILSYRRMWWNYRQVLFGSYMTSYWITGYCIGSVKVKYFNKRVCWSKDWGRCDTSEDPSRKKCISKTLDIELFEEAKSQTTKKACDRRWWRYHHFGKRYDRFWLIKDMYLTRAECRKRTHALCPNYLYKGFVLFITWANW